MNLPIIYFETAKELKELGFNYETNWWYDDDGFLWKIRSSENFNSRIWQTSAPTQSLVLKWFREVHKIEVFVQPFIDDDGEIYPPFDYTYYVYDTTVPHGKTHMATGDCSVHEEAEAQGISVAIEYLKKKLK